MTYEPTDSTDSTDSAPGTTTHDTHNDTRGGDAPNLRPSPDLTGLEKLPSGRWRVKLRDPTRDNAWMPGGSFATPEEAQDYRRGLRAELADLLASGAPVEGTLDAFVADGRLPEAAVQDLLDAVQGLPLVRLARELDQAPAHLRAPAALKMAVEALSVRTDPVVVAVSAVSAGSDGGKAL